MPGKTVIKYEERLEENIKESLKKNPAYRKSPTVTIPITLEEISKAPLSLALLVEKGMSKVRINSLILGSLCLEITKFSLEGAGCLWQCPTRHYGIAHAIIDECNKASRHPSSQETINHVKQLLEHGVLLQKCNPKGNYANLCRAITNKTAHLDGWAFSEAYKEALGIETFPSFSPRS